MSYLAKLSAARDYLRQRGKLLAETGCFFSPTSAAEQFFIIERYGMKVGYIVKAEITFIQTSEDGKPMPPKIVIKQVSGTFTIRSAAEQFAELYAREHPDHRVYIKDMSAQP